MLDVEVRFNYQELGLFIGAPSFVKSVIEGVPQTNRVAHFRVAQQWVGWVALPRFLAVGEVAQAMVARKDSLRISNPKFSHRSLGRSGT